MPLVPWPQVTTGHPPAGGVPLGTATMPVTGDERVLGTGRLVHHAVQGGADEAGSGTASDLIKVPGGPAGRGWGTL